MLPLESLVNSFSGKTAQEITNILNTDQVAWRPIALVDLDAYASLKGVKVFLTMVNAATAFDSPIKPAVLAAIDLFSARFTNLDMHNPEVRTKVGQIMGALSQVPGTVVDQAFIDGLNTMASSTSNQARQINGGELLTVNQVQAAMDRSAVRATWTVWRLKAENRIDSDTTVPTFADLLTTTPD